jgi:hypothetical protein
MADIVVTNSLELNMDDVESITTVKASEAIMRNGLEFGTITHEYKKIDMHSGRVIMVTDKKDIEELNSALLSRFYSGIR